MRRFLITLLCLAPWLSQAQLESTSDLQRGLVGWWRFNEGTGTNAFDLSGNANTGTLSGSTLPVWTNGVFGGALLFDGSSSYITNSLSTALSANFSICSWVKPNSQVESFGCLIGSTAAAPTLGYTSSGHLNLYYGGSHSSTGTLVNAKWSHIVVSCNSGNTTFYINGAAAGTATNFVSGTLTLIGWDSGTEFFKGSLDDVRIYNRALSAIEVLNLFCQGGGRTP